MVILAAIDRSNKATTVLQEADKLAQSFDEEIHILHVLSRSEFMDLERTSVNETGDAVSMQRVRQIAKDHAAEMAKEVSSPSSAVGRMGNPSKEVLKYADEQDARYIVISGRKRSPTGKAFFGSVSQPILLNATCPVVSIVSQD
jgi:nucleotide-binding universal stress UspA family protein